MLHKMAIGDQRKRYQMFDEVFGKHGILKTSKDATAFEKNSIDFLTKYHAEVEGHSNFMSSFLERLLTNVLNPSWTSTDVEGKQSQVSKVVILEYIIQSTRGPLLKRLY